MADGYAAITKLVEAALRAGCDKDDVMEVERLACRMFSKAQRDATLKLVADVKAMGTRAVAEQYGITQRAVQKRLSIRLSKMRTL